MFTNCYLTESEDEEGKSFQYSKESGGATLASKLVITRQPQGTACGTLACPQSGPKDKHIVSILALPKFLLATFTQRKSIKISNQKIIGSSLV